MRLTGPHTASSRWMILWLSGLAFAPSAWAGLDLAGTGTAVVHVSGSSGMKFEATTSDVRFTDDGATYRVVVTLANLTTLSEPRDKQMRNLLEVTKYPTASFAIAHAGVTLGGEGTASGDLTIHGLKKNVHVHYRNTDGAVHATATITLVDFGISPPTYLGAQINSAVDLEVTLPARSGATAPSTGTAPATPRPTPPGRTAPGKTLVP